MKNKSYFIALSALLLLAALSFTVTYAQAQTEEPTPEPTPTIEPLPGQPLPQNLTAAAIIVILPSAGGTTSPRPGTYAMANATSTNIQATAQEGWQFSHWTISAAPGSTTSHGTAPVNWEPTDNPYNVNHGYGGTYNYQAVFTRVGGVTPTATATATTTATPGTGIAGVSIEFLIIIGLVIVLVIVILAALVALRRKK